MPTYPKNSTAAHGTRARRVAGCTCEPCKEAHRLYEHQRRLRNGEAFDAPEGYLAASEAAAVRGRSPQNIAHHRRMGRMPNSWRHPRSGRYWYAPEDLAPLPEGDGRAWRARRRLSHAA